MLVWSWSSSRVFNPPLSPGMVLICHYRRSHCATWPYETKLPCQLSGSCNRSLFSHRAFLSTTISWIWLWSDSQHFSDWYSPNWLFIRRGRDIHHWSRIICDFPRYVPVTSYNISLCVPKCWQGISGTTFAVISSAAKSIDLSQTRVGSILVSAAVIDDVVGLVLSR